MNTSMRKLLQRLLAIALSFAMLPGLLPMTAFAESDTSTIAVGGEIIAFEPLPDAAANQAVPLGASLDKLNLPETLTTTVCVAAATQTVSAQAYGKPEPSVEAPEATEMTIPVSAIWLSKPEYDGDTAGTYIFTPTLALPNGLTVAEGVQPPTITITAAAELAGKPMLFGAMAAEQFSLAPGGTYYFNLSAQGVPGTVNTALPDTSLKWVPFTYAGTVNAYSLDASSSGNTSASGNATASDRSLFVADYNIAHTTVSWNDLNGAGLIFGKAYNAGGVAYTLRSLSVGSSNNGQSGGSNERGTPETNEWDQILNKNGAYLKNWNGRYSWGQDTSASSASSRAFRGIHSSRHFNKISASTRFDYYGFRPALEILNPATLNADGLKTVTYDMDGNGTLGSGSLATATVVYTGSLILPEITPANGFTYIGTGTGALGWYAGTVFHQAGTSLVLDSGTTLKAGREPILSSEITGDFTDANFLAEVRTALGKGASDPIYDTDNFASVTSLSVSNKSISSLAGIEYFSALTSLDCSGNQIPSLDVSDNTALTSLNCCCNQIPSLNVSHNTVLTELSCGGNQLTELDLSSNTALTFLNCYNNPLTALDLSSNTALTELNCSKNQLTALDLSKNTALDELYCERNQLAALDLSSNTALSRLECANNQLAVLNVSSNIALTRLYCGSNQLPTLDVSNNSNLTSLDCKDNYMPGESAITGLDETLTTSFSFYPQHSGLPPVNAVRPSINSQPAGATYTQNASAAALSVTATITDSGTLSYQWYKNTGNSTIGGTPVGINSSDYTPPTNTVGTTWYYCVVTNTNPGATGNQTAAAASNTAAVTVNAPGTVSATGVSLNQSTLALYSNTAPNTATLIATVTPSDAANKAVTWQSSNTAVATVDQSGNIKAVGKGTATITATTTDGGYTVSCTVTVTTYNSGGGNGGGSGGGSTPPAATPATPQTQPNQPTAGTAPVTATAGANGTASAAVSDKAIADAIARAQADAKAQGRTANGISVALNVTMPQGATSLMVTLTQSSLNSLVSAGVSQLEINGAPVSLGLDLEALQEIQRQSNGNISVSFTPATGLSKAAKALLGNRPVYNVTISYTDKNGKTQNISGLGSGTATLSIPYAPGRNEAVGYLFGVYVDGKGNATRIPGSAYDPNSGSILLNTNHFSVYGVGYEAPSAKFTDIGSHWAKESIDYVIGRGLLSGTSKTTFAPNTAMTRGMLVTALGRLAGVDVKACTQSDVKADSAFRPYIEWAYKKGIVQGIDNQQFAPDRAITREEIAVIFANFAKATGYKLPVTREATTYADVSNIGSVYKTAVTAMQQAGIMMEENDNRFNPKAGATRAEASAMLHRYIKLTIDPATAQGWALNDAGQYLYYKDGKALTGWQTVDGVKYFFETTGVLKTGWVKDGGNWRYYTGNKSVVDWLDISDKRYYFTNDGIMVSGKWLEIGGKWYYFYADGSLARSTKIDNLEVDENGVRKSK